MGNDNCCTANTTGDEHSKEASAMNSMNVGSKEHPQNGSGPHQPLNHEAQLPSHDDYGKKNENAKNPVDKSSGKPPEFVIVPTAVNTSQYSQNKTVIVNQKVADATLFSPPEEILDLVKKYGTYSFTESNYPGANNPYKEIIKDDSKYYGQVDMSGRMQGRGQLYTNNCLHIGYFDKDMKSGPGKTYLTNKQYISAGWQDDLLNGPCTYHNDELNQWSQNMYVLNKKHGFGEETWGDGSYFKGEYRDGAKDGKGEMKWPDGNTYKGDFHKGHIEGIGTYSWADGKYYTGEWRNDQMNGNGEFHWPDGRKYIGSYKDDLKDGYGVFYWTDQKRYEGNWSKGKQHGKGKYYNEKGEVKEGVWVNGTR
jgi:hypothetical protein